MGESLSYLNIDNLSTLSMCQWKSAHKTKHVMHWIVIFIIQLHFVEYKYRSKRVKISSAMCTPEDRLDRFSRNAQATNLIEVTEKMADNLNYFSDDEESA